MIVTTMTSLIILLNSYIINRNYILITVDVLMFILAVGVTVLVIKTFLKPMKQKEIFSEEKITEPALH